MRVFDFEHGGIWRPDAGRESCGRCDAQRDEEDSGRHPGRQFAQEWIEENKDGGQNFTALREKGEAAPDRDRGSAVARNDELAAEEGKKAETAKPTGESWVRQAVNA